MKTDKKLKLHIGSLITVYESFAMSETQKRKANLHKISTNRLSREICNSASIRIEAYNDFINQLKGVLTVMSNQNKSE